MYHKTQPEYNNMATETKTNYQDVHMSLAENVRYFRTRAGLTQAELAERCGTQHASISHIENGRGNPTLLTMMKIAEQVGTTVDRLLVEIREPEKIR